MVLMIVLKYLMGHFFFLMARFGAVNTFGPQEVKGLKQGVIEGDFSLFLSSSLVTVCVR